jgi:hypothetical protein
MAKAHAAEYGRSRADEYRRKAEDCRVHAERASGNWKAKWFDLAERWDEAADRLALSQAAVKARHVRDIHL